MRLKLQFGGCCPAFSGAALKFKGTDSTDTPEKTGEPAKKPVTRVASIQLQCDPGAAKLTGGMTTDDVSRLVKVSTQAVSPKIISFQETPEPQVPGEAGSENKAASEPVEEEKPADKSPAILPESLKPKPLKGMDWVLEHMTNLLSKFTS